MLPHNSAESPRIRPGLPPLFVAQRLDRSWRDALRAGPKLKKTSILAESRLRSSMTMRSGARPAILQLLHPLAQRLQFGTQLLDFGTPFR
jgi:hypothetical protein